MKEKFFYQIISAFECLSLPDSSFSLIVDLASCVRANHLKGWLICAAEAWQFPYYLKLSGSVNKVGKAASNVFLVSPLIGV